MVGLSRRLSLTRERKLVLVKAIKYKITPHTRCPECGHIFDPETEKGWSDDPADCLITCPECGHRFKGRLEVEPRQVTGTREVHRGFYSFLCPAQTIEAMRRLMQHRKVLGEKFLHDKHPEIYFSAIKNFASYRTARATLRKTS